MESFGLGAFFTIVGIIALYAIVTNRMMHGTQRLRRMAAELAAEVIKDERTPKRTARAMYRMIDMLFSRKFIWMAVIMFIPAVIMSKVSPADIPQTGHDDLDSKIRSAMSFYAQSVLGLSPIATILIMIQAAVVFLIVGSHKAFTTIVKDIVGNSITPHNHHGHA
tara:strand:- start:11879 stop:12373 length:495 start_codon:yes stop_codon:yes gene_type:complete